MWKGWGMFSVFLVIVIKGMHMYTCTCYIDVQQTLSLTVQASSMVEEPRVEGIRCGQRGSPSSKAERPEFLIGAHTRMHSLPIRLYSPFSQKLRIKKISMDYGSMIYYGLWLARRMMVRMEEGGYSGNPSSLAVKEITHLPFSIHPGGRWFAGQVRGHHGFLGWCPILSVV